MAESFSPTPEAIYLFDSTSSATLAEDRQDQCSSAEQRKSPHAGSSGNYGRCPGRCPAYPHCCCCLCPYPCPGLSQERERSSVDRSQTMQSRASADSYFNILSRSC